MLAENIQSEYVMRRLILIPTESEFTLLMDSLNELGYEVIPEETGRLSSYRVVDTDMCITPGGLGKTQFGVQTQHLLDHYPDCEVVICAGAGGAIIDSIDIGDIVIGTQTVEHDI